MIRFALIVASTLGFFLTAALGNFMVPLLRAFGPGQEPEAPQTSQLQPDSDPDDLPPPATPTMGGLCLMVGTLAAVGVGWTAACVAEPALLGDEGLWTTRLLIALFGALAFGAVGLADDLARLRRHAPLGLRRPVRLGLEAAAAGVEARHVDTYREAAELLLARMQPGDALLVKASRGMALEKVLEIFYNEQK